MATETGEEGGPPTWRALGMSGASLGARRHPQLVVSGGHRRPGARFRHPNFNLGRAKSVRGPGRERNIHSGPVTAGTPPSQCCGTDATTRTGTTTALANPQHPLMPTQSAR